MGALKNLGDTVSGYLCEQAISTFNRLGLIKEHAAFSSTDIRNEHPSRAWTDNGYILGVAQDVATVIGAVSYLSGTNNDFTYVAATVGGVKLLSNGASLLIQGASGLIKKLIEGKTKPSQTSQS